MLCEPTAAIAAHQPYQQTDAVESIPSMDWGGGGGYTSSQRAVSKDNVSILGYLGNVFVVWGLYSFVLSKALYAIISISLAYCYQW